MSKPQTLMVQCSCTLRKKFPYTLRLSDHAGGGSPVSLQIDCPFSYEDKCAKKLTVQLPPGKAPDQEVILRE